MDAFANVELTEQFEIDSTPDYDEIESFIEMEQESYSQINISEGINVKKN